MKRCIPITVALATALVLAGCSGGGTEPASSVLLPDNAQSLEGEVTWWGWTGVDTVNPIIEEFNKAYPDITVNYKFVDFSSYASSLRPGLSSGSGPDVFTLQAGAIASQFGPLAADIEPLLAQQLGDDWSEKITAGYPALETDGQLRAAPMGTTSAGTLLVNKTLLDSLGLSVPDESTTLDEWQSLCATITAAEKTCLGQGGQDAWQNIDLFQSLVDSYEPGLFRQAVDGTGEWSDENIVDALAAFQGMFANGTFQEGAVGATVADVVNGFGQQNVAMTLLGTWGANTYLESGITGLESGAGVADPTAFTTVLARFPDIAGRGNEVPLFGDPDGLAINPNTPNAEAAAALVSWITMSQEGQQFLADGLTVIPSLEGISARPTGLVDPSVQETSLQSLTEAAQSSDEQRQIAYPELTTALGAALQSVATGEDPTSVAATLQQASAAITRG